MLIQIQKKIMSSFSQSVQENVRNPRVQKLNRYVVQPIYIFTSKHSVEGVVYWAKINVKTSCHKEAYEYCMGQAGGCLD